jgi:hypothetical protein
MTGCLEFARPIVRRGASLCADQTCWQLLKERNYLETLQLAANNHLVSVINAMNLKAGLAMSRPIVVTVCMDSSSESWEA